MFADLNRTKVFLFTIAVGLTGQLSSVAAIDVWNGSSTTSTNWSDSANWIPQSPSNGDDVWFATANNNQTNNVDNLNLSLDSLAFLLGGDSFTIELTSSLSFTGPGTTQ